MSQLVLRTRHDLLSSVLSGMSQGAWKNASERQRTAGEISDNSVMKIPRRCAVQSIDL